MNVTVRNSFIESSAVYFKTGETARSQVLSCSCPREEMFFVQRLYVSKSAIPDMEEGESMKVTITIERRA